MKARDEHTTAVGRMAEIDFMTNLINSATLPTNLIAVSLDASATTNTNALVQWSALTGSARGGQNVAITSYELYWD